MINDARLERYKRKLEIRAGEIGGKVLKILCGESNSEVLYRVDIHDLSPKYRRFLGGRSKGKTLIILRDNQLKHIYRRGHLTGKAIFRYDDKHPLSPADWERLKKVFLDPDIVIRHGEKLVIDKRFYYGKLRLILTHTKTMQRCFVITFFRKTR